MCQETYRGYIFINISMKIKLSRKNHFFDFVESRSENTVVD